MKTLETFKSYFESLLINEFQVLEAERLKLLKSRNTAITIVIWVFVITGVLYVAMVFSPMALVILFLVVVSIVSVLSSLFQENPWLCLLYVTLFLGLGLLILGACIFALISIYRAQKTAPKPVNRLTIPLRKGACWTLAQFKKAFKEQVITKIATYVFEDSTYQENGFVSQSEFSGCQFFRRQIDRYSGEDLFSAHHGKTEIRFSELKAQHRDVRYDSKGNTYYVWITLFKGTFLVADFHKDFKGKTILVPEAFSYFEGKTPDLEKVTLEDPNFEKYYRVYSTNQIEARYILSTSMMAHLTQLWRKTGHQLPMISFFDSKMHIAFRSERDLFEPVLNESLLDVNIMQKHFLELQKIVDIVELLDLNTRIWSKD